ncbi:MAG: PIG-L family deacetylase [Acidobacteria bacterium]|nr:PIG-L family deacetylase [Acidobacteriota bacterium]MBS1866902.1 PIG-L family deacetylase [Acidobacteriota bacterium]
MRRYLLLGLSLLLASTLTAQLPYDSAIKASPNAHEITFNRGSTALWQSLKKLHTRASLIMITAHPDDEDGGMLTYESRGQGARVALLTLNRGEGGANVMSADYFDGLGLVRTEELLAAGRYYGVDQYWTRVVDYGFSKTKAESIAKWTHDRVLYDVVRVVRMTRPLVITSVFVGGPTDGHGNHQTAGAMAQEVFKAAGDSNVFPDQIAAGLKPWTPLKDYARTPWFGNDDGKFSVNVAVPEGEYDPVLGASYVQIAREGLGHQKSQTGGGTIPNAGAMSTTYHRFGSVVTAEDQENSFFDGIDVSLMGIATLAKGSEGDFLRPGLQRLNGTIESAIADFSPLQPEKIAPRLAEGWKITEELLKQVKSSSLSEADKYNISFELEVKKAQFNNALAQSLGLSIAAVMAPEHEPDPRFAMFMGNAETTRIAIPGQKFGVKVHVVSQGSNTVRLEEVKIRTTDGKDWEVKSLPAANGELTKNKPIDARFDLVVPKNAPYTRPYFSRPDIEQSYYDISDLRYLNCPLSPYPVEAWAEFSLAGVPISVGQVVQTTKRVTGLGEVLEPLVVGPAVSLSISPRASIVPLNAKFFDLTASLRSNLKGPAKGTVKLELPKGWTSKPAVAEFSTKADGDETSTTFQVVPTGLTEKSYEIKAVAEFDGQTYREGYELTGYPGLRPYYLYRPSVLRTTGVDVKVAEGLRVGYIAGSGDDVPASLQSLGIHVHFLTANDVASGDLSSYSVILMGVRAYAAREELKTYNGRLLDFVKNGGVLIVQYNTQEYDQNFGPYPYVMGQFPEEVTDEASKMKILAPQNPLFLWPNPITERDFAGWVEERGSKFLKSWDPRYEALLSTEDEGQEPQKGGLLYARYGKGVYIYNAYAFYRQLPEGVPGAFRLIANMISLPKNPHLGGSNDKN